MYLLVEISSFARKYTDVFINFNVCTIIIIDLFTRFNHVFDINFIFLINYFKDFKPYKNIFYDS